MNHKIATCNYCGTRAALVLDRTRHELTCSSCGAPLHDMKSMPKAKSDRQRPKGRPMTLPRQECGEGRCAVPSPRKPGKKRRKGIGRRIFEEIWDVVEDVFD